MSEEHLPAIKRVYDSALALWHETKVERHAEGHPGVAGAPGIHWSRWSESQGHLEGAVEMLKTILERKFLVGSVGEEGALGPDVVPKELWKICPYCRCVHHPLAGCARPPDRDVTGMLSSSGSPNDCPPWP